MTDRLTEAELADRSAVSPDDIRRLVGLGILQAQDGEFERADVMRTRVVSQLEAIGIEADALATALASGHLRLGYLESAGRRQPRSDLTFVEIADQIGIEFSTLESIYIAFGLARPEAGERVREEDLEALRRVGILFAAGLEERDVLSMARVWGDSSRRVAQYLPHYFHNTIEERFRQRGLGDNEAYETALMEVGLRMGRSGEDLLGWLFRRHAEGFLNQHQFEHVETALELAGVRHRSPRQVETAVFADLTGFTALTEELGDHVAAETAVSFAQLAGEVATRHGGSVIKLLGDGVFLHFPDPNGALLASLEIVDSTTARELPPAHIGADAGPMLYDEGDYFGRTINMAARIASHAGPGQVYVGEALLENASGDGIDFADMGECDLKGIAKPVRIFQATRRP